MVILKIMSPKPVHFKTKVKQWTNKKCRARQCNVQCVYKLCSVPYYTIMMIILRIGYAHFLNIMKILYIWRICIQNIHPECVTLHNIFRKRISAFFLKHICPSTPRKVLVVEYLSNRKIVSAFFLDLNVFSHTLAYWNLASSFNLLIKNLIQLIRYPDRILKVVFWKLRKKTNWDDWENLVHDNNVPDIKSNYTWISCLHGFFKYSSSLGKN